MGGCSNTTCKHDFDRVWLATVYSMTVTMTMTPSQRQITAFKWLFELINIVNTAICNHSCCSWDMVHVFGVMIMLGHDHVGS